MTKKFEELVFQEMEHQPTKRNAKRVAKLFNTTVAEIIRIMLNHNYVECYLCTRLTNKTESREPYPGKFKCRVCEHHSREEEQ